MQAQSVPTPGAKQTLPIILTNATIHQGNGKVIERGDLLIENGIITEIGRVSKTFKQAESIDLKGKHVYPGLITVNSFLGLEEINAVRATRDKAEVGLLNANARSIISYNTDSRVTPTIRTNGILIAQIAPQGAGFTGSSSIVQLDAWNWEDALIKVDDAVYLSWPRMVYKPAPWLQKSVEELKKDALKNVDKIYETMDAVKAYSQAKDNGKVAKHNLAFDALVPVIKKEKKLFIRANSEQQILAAIEFKIRYDIDIVIVGGRESYLQTVLLRQYDIPVVLYKVHQLPVQEDDDIDQPFRIPSILQEAGITFCFAMDDMWNERNLPFQAGTAAAYGLPKEDAVKSITLNAAKILGIDDKLGSLEVGKQGTLIVTEGDLLDMRTSNVVHAFIEGRKVALRSRQIDLYEKFKQKYADQ